MLKTPKMRSGVFAIKQREYFLVIKKLNSKACTSKLKNEKMNEKLRITKKCIIALGMESSMFFLTMS